MSTRNELLADAAIALAVLAASLALLFAAGGDAGAPAVLLSALASLPLIARRIAPLRVFVVTALASTALAGITAVAGPPIGATLALYWAAASGARTWPTLALVAALLAAHVAASGVATDRFPATEILFGVLVWGAAWLAGDRTRLRHERMAELEQRALLAEREAEHERRLAAAEERTRIARDLHDSAGHAINVILVHAGLGRLRSEEGHASAREQFETIEQVARETVGEIDDLVGALREDAPRGEQVEPPPGLAAIGALAERHRAAGMDVTTAVGGERRPLPAGVDRGAYRILQEALTNAARHGAGSARVEVAYGASTVELTVANPLGADRRPPGGGHGIVGMRERASLLGGSLEASARDGHFHVHARLPVAGGRA